MNNIQARLVRLETLEPRLNALQASIGYIENAVDSLIYAPRYVAGDEVGFNGQLLRKKIRGTKATAMTISVQGKR